MHENTTHISFFVATVATYLSRGKDVRVEDLARNYMKNMGKTCERHYIMRHYLGVQTIKYSMSMYDLFKLETERTEEDMKK